MSFWLSHRPAVLGLPVTLVLLLAGCAANEHEVTTGALPYEGVHVRREVIPDDEAEGRKHFQAGRYGLAERHFRSAVETYPKNSAAWVGLAASYDQLKRFDLAERAYHRAIELEGRTASLLNNLGYHHLLRGNHGKARHYFTSAAQLEPHNPRIQANLRLLDTGRPEVATR